jgi:nitrogen fixation protein NifX
MTTIRVAFASDDRVRVNQHFGAAEGFVIHDVGPDKTALVAVGEFVAAAMDSNENEVSVQGNAGEAGVSRNHDKLAAKIDFLAGCAAVFVMAIGASAIKQLVAADIQPVRVAPAEGCGDRIDAILADIQAGMRAGGVPWIDKALAAQKSPERFARMAEEAWEE